MRTLAFLIPAVLFTACPATSFDAGPPVDRFYFPTGIVHVDSAAAPEGLLYVASANFDKRYEAGSILAMNLSKAGLPVFGAPVTATGPVQLTTLPTTAAGKVEISSFGGEMASLDLGNGGIRLFIPSRSEGMKFQAVDAHGIATASADPVLECYTPEGKERDCGTQAPSLDTLAVEQSVTGLPRAPSPFGVGVKPRHCTVSDDCGADVCRSGACVRVNGAAGNENVGDVFVTHLSQADSPYLSATNYRGYLVHLDSTQRSVAPENYIDIGSGSSNSAASGQRWTYVSGRYLNPSPNLIRLVDTNGLVFTTGLETSFRVTESRGLALSSDESRLYLAVRQPDMLLVVHITDPGGAYPSLSLARAVPLPEGANEVQVIPRAGRSDLIVVTCSTAGVVVLYDDDVGDVVSQVPGVGLQPFAIAVDRRGPGARLFVTDFGDGRVAVIDIPQLDQPQGARLVAHLGAQQLCLTRGPNEPSCGDGGTP